MSDVRIDLSRSWDWGTERALAQCGGLSVSYFRYPSGTQALRVKSDVGEMVLLPFQGQQVWDATFRGRSLTMRTMFEQPIPTTEYLRNYGAFLIHCGATAMGPPGAGDTHPPHGELPNASFDTAHLTFGDDAEGVAYAEVGGEYRHTVGFNTNYVFRPTVRTTLGSTALSVSVEIENLKRSPMELMYLAHANFRATDGVQIIDNAKRVRLRNFLPSHVRPPAGFAEMMAQLEENPDSHRRISADTTYDPEVVFFLDFECDEAVCVAAHSDGGGDFIRYSTRELPRSTRWISKTVDQQCLGLALPGTAESEGLSRERHKGNVISLGPREIYRCSYKLGSVDEAGARELRQLIARSTATEPPHNTSKTG